MNRTGVFGLVGIAAAAGWLACSHGPLMAAAVATTSRTEAVEATRGIPAGAPLLSLAQSRPPIFTAGTDVVPVYATVIDSQSRLVPDLAREDFLIFDNTKPQSITQFSNEPLPITVVVMLDTSASMTMNLDLLKKSAEQFLIRLLPEDRGRVGAFNDKIQYASDFTNNRDELVSSLEDLQFGNPTRLYDAIESSLGELRDTEGRRVVLVFTDGDDTASKTGLGNVIEQARIQDAMVYAIGLQSEMNFGGRTVRTKPDRGLKKLADETGGGFFELDDAAALGPTFNRVAQELHSQYLLGFAPASMDGKIHKLETRTSKPGLTVRARKSYLAKSSAAGSGR